MTYTRGFRARRRSEAHLAAHVADVVAARLWLRRVPGPRCSLGACRGTQRTHSLDRYRTPHHAAGASRSSCGGDRSPDTVSYKLSVGRCQVVARPMGIRSDLDGHAACQCRRGISRSCVSRRSARPGSTRHRLRRRMRLRRLAVAGRRAVDRLRGMPRRDNISSATNRNTNPC